ncbi:MAG TPA: type 1 glutamine amidotransferase domain-containing protein [Noviherbaspirillum sp.]|jgi:protease I|uniref:type 1 glutamine amidotransferase domain-containing protein n=1 Tax=Noviherbaspirillum sp. TaxID=1926288 RepID=UPI002F91D7F3
MFGRKTLKGRRVAVLAADGVEKIELAAPVAALRAQGADVEIVSLHPGSIRAVNLHEAAGTIAIDRVLAEADAQHYDGLLIPGGYINPDLLRQSAQARRFVHAFDVARKPIATLCHGPWVLASANLTRGRTLTSWPGMRDDMVNAGANWLDREVVRDGNWVTSRGPQDMQPFVQAMCELFALDAPIPYGAARAAWSDPQRREPPPLVPAAMAIPRPSVRALLGLAVLGAGVVVAARRRQAATPPRPATTTTALSYKPAA